MIDHQMIRDAIIGVEARSDDLAEKMDDIAWWTDEWVALAKEFIALYERSKELSAILAGKPAPEPEGPEAESPVTGCDVAKGSE